jgi:Flp pilus assembly pilin Flp
MWEKIDNWLRIIFLEIERLFGVCVCLVKQFWKWVIPFIKKYSKQRSGAQQIEYGLIAMLMGLGIVVASQEVSGEISQTFETIAQVMRDVRR